MTFSEKLTLLRKCRGLSQEQLAEMLDVSRQSVSKWEAQQAMPETSKIILLGEIFNVSIDLLLKDEQCIEMETPSVILEQESKDEQHPCSETEVTGKTEAEEGAGCVAEAPVTVAKKTDRAHSKAKKAWAVSVAAVILLLCGIGIILGRIHDRPQPVVICDVSQFANISSAELVELIGKPNGIEKTTTNGFAEFPCVYYEYHNDSVLGEVSFILINDSVVKLVSYNTYPYQNGKNLLGSFNLTLSEGSVKDETATYARYRCINDSVDDLWVTNIDTTADMFGTLQVTYDMFYFEEWYLPTSTGEESDYQYWTQEHVKSLLKSPATADFPNILNWTILKNKFYVIAQSYVDAQNSFGATVRSEFTFLYAADTSNVVYAVFDGEVVADNGFVKTEELVSKLIDPDKTEAALSVKTVITEQGAKTTDQQTETEHPKESGQGTTTSKQQTAQVSTGTATQAAVRPSVSTEPEPTGVGQADAAVCVHNYSGWENYDESQHQRYCRSCYETEQENHSWDGGEVLKASTCSQGGEKRFVCSVCRAEKTESLDKLAHDFSQKAEKADYLKSEATYTAGSVYYYSCSCGERGTETFTLTDKKEWISADELHYGDHQTSSAWMGEYIWMSRTDWDTNTEYEFKIYGAPESRFEPDQIYNGDCNGKTVRFKYSNVSSNTQANLFFHYEDLKSVGII